MRILYASSFSRNTPYAQNARVMASGFLDFLARHTGRTESSTPAGTYVMNDEGILAVTLHDATLDYGWDYKTSLSTYHVEMIQGAFAMWKATGERRYYDLFMQVLTAYRTHFYGGVEIPPFASIWRANYIINARAPFTLGAATVDRNQPYDPWPVGQETAITDPSVMGNYPRVDLELAEVLINAFQYTAERDFQVMINSILYTVFDFISNMAEGNPGAALPYVPGAVPGEPGDSPRLMRRASWSGMCYTAYQYPSGLAVAGHGDEMMNVLALYEDSQNAYLEQKNIDGPFFTMYAWDRPDNPLPAGQVWGASRIVSDNARTFMNAARLLAVLTERNTTIPTSLVDICTRHANWVAQFVVDNGALPVFDANMLPVVEPVGSYDSTLVATLYLTGLIYMARSDQMTPALETLRQFCFTEMSKLYSIEPTNPSMSGAFSPSAAAGQYFSEHGGLMLRALGELISWETRFDPAVVRPVGVAKVLLENETGFVQVETGDGVVLKEESQPEE